LAVLPFLAAAILMELTPGPNMSWLAMLSATRGRMAGLRAVAGVSLGLALLGTAAAFGLTAVIHDIPAIYGLIRWAGVAFLVFLAVEAWFAKPAADTTAANIHGWFWRGAIVNLLNPKAAIVYVTLVPQALPPEGDRLANTLALSAIYVTIATVVHVGIVLFASTLTRFAAQPERQQFIQKLFAVLMIGVALWVAVETAPGS
jgi:threonine/homoserine/homoserine lactone efflux protein